MLNRRDLFKAAAGLAAAGTLPAVAAQGVEFVGAKYAIVSVGQIGITLPKDYRIVSSKRTPVYSDSGELLRYVHEYMLEEVAA